MKKTTNARAAKAATEPVWRTILREARDFRYVVAGIATTALLTPTPALAATEAGNLLNTLKGLLAGGGGFLGGGMVLFGAITIGTNVSGASQGNGAAISSGVAMVIGGVIIAAASFYFSSLDTSWATA